jgi:hypothetical protein
LKGKSSDDDERDGVNHLSRVYDKRSWIVGGSLADSRAFLMGICAFSGGHRDGWR